MGNVETPSTKYNPTRSYTWSVWWKMLILSKHFCISRSPKTNLFLSSWLHVSLASLYTHHHHLLLLLIYSFFFFFSSSSLSFSLSLSLSLSQVSPDLKVVLNLNHHEELSLFLALGSHASWPCLLGFIRHPTGPILQPHNHPPPPPPPPPPPFL